MYSVTPRDAGLIAKLPNVHNMFKKLLWCSSLLTNVIIVFDGRHLPAPAHFLDVLDSPETAVLLFTSDTTTDPIKAGQYKAGLLADSIKEWIMRYIDRTYIEVADLYELEKLLKDSKYVHRKGFGNHENTNIGG